MRGTAAVMVFVLLASPALARGGSSHSGGEHSGGEHSGIRHNGAYNLGGPANNAQVFEDSKLGKDEMQRRQATWDLSNGVAVPARLVTRW